MCLIVGRPFPLQRSRLCLDAVVSESLGERVVVDLELYDLVVLVGRHSNELGGRKRTGGNQLGHGGEVVMQTHHVHTGLVLVHRVEQNLQFNSCHVLLWL